VLFKGEGFLGDDGITVDAAAVLRRRCAELLARYQD
jgi:hypothetical protein